MQDYRNLLVWQKAHQMVLSVYSATGKFPPGEKFGLIAQLRRSAVSVPSNIVEGSARGSSAEFLRFLQIAFGSCSEVEYQLYLARDLGYFHPDDFKTIIRKVIEVKRMLNGLIFSISREKNTR